MYIYTPESSSSYILSGNPNNSFQVMQFVTLEYTWFQVKI